MAGHSQFANIKHKKEAQDSKRAKVFTKVARIVEVAARSGPDPNMNHKLRTAIATARKVNMPKSKIDQAILKGSGGSTATNYDEVRYECRHSGSGICFIISALTDNRNRTASDVKTALGKHGAILATPGSVTYMFDNIGKIDFASTVPQADLLEKAVESGAMDVEEYDELTRIYVPLCNLERISTELEESFGESLNSGIVWKAKEYIAINSDEAAQKFFDLIDVLEDLDDVQNIYANVPLA